MPRTAILVNMPAIPAMVILIIIIVSNRVGFRNRIDNGVLSNFCIMLLWFHRSDIKRLDKAVPRCAGIILIIWCVVIIRTGTIRVSPRVQPVLLG